MMSKIGGGCWECVVCVGSHYVGHNTDHSKRGVDRQGLKENGVVDQKGIKELK